jgi:non-ribosomal peptide synthetase component F
MWAGGVCVTRGYLNLPEKTNERYKEDPFVNDGWVATNFPLVFGADKPVRSMMFNTGDLG